MIPNEISTTVSGIDPGYLKSVAGNTIDAARR
jgi:hypothetical protein